MPSAALASFKSKGMVLVVKVFLLGALVTILKAYLENWCDFPVSSNVDCQNSQASGFTRVLEDRTPPLVCTLCLHR